MHIVFLSLDYPAESGGGGVGTEVRAIAHELVERGHRVTVAAMTAGDEVDKEADGEVKVIRFAQGNAHWYASKLPWIGARIAPAIREWERSWNGYRALQDLGRELPFEIVEITESGGLFAGRLRRGGARVVARLHGEPYTSFRHANGIARPKGLNGSRVLQRRSLRRADVLISPSAFHGFEVARELGRPESSIRLIPNLSGASGLLSPDEISNRISDPRSEASPVVLFAGRLERIKGIEVLIRAAPAILDRHPGVRFVCAGASHPHTPSQELDHLLGEMRVDQAFEFVGHLRRERLAEVYGAATLFVSPSYYESFGLAVLEAMTAGLPVVAAASGAVQELIVDGETGILFPPGDTIALAEGVNRLLEHREEAHRLGRAAMKGATSRFDPGRIMEQNLEAYRSAMTRRCISEESS